MSIENVRTAMDEARESFNTILKLEHEAHEEVANSVGELLQLCSQLVELLVDVPPSDPLQKIAGRLVLESQSMFEYYPAQLTRIAKATHDLEERAERLRLLVREEFVKLGG